MKTKAKKAKKAKKARKVKAKAKKAKPEKKRGDTWVGKRPAVFKDRKKEVNRQGESKRPKHKKDYKDFT